MQSIPQLKEGEIIGGCYRVVARIGEGGMGSVYKVEHTLMGRTCALKTIESPGDKSGRQADWKRFQNEAKLIASMNHKDIIQVYDSGVTDSGIPYYVMEYVEGKTLLETVRRFGQLDVRKALTIFIEVAEGLAYAHNNKLVHRDIKPSNIMVIKGGELAGEVSVKLIDFGIAETGPQAGEAIAGTPAYMSPQQFQNGNVDFRSDIYSFGCTLFEALTGVPPFIGDSALVLSMKHVNEQPPTLSQASLGKEFPAELEMILARLLAKVPLDRYQNMTVVAEDLQGVLDLLNQPKRTVRARSATPPPGKIAAVNIPPDIADSQNITRSPPPGESLLINLLVRGGITLVFALGGATWYAWSHPFAPQLNALQTKAREMEAQAHPSPTLPTQTLKQTNEAAPVDEASSKADQHTPFSSIAVDKLGKKMRVFKFPPGVNLGMIWDTTSHEDKYWQAEGQFTVDARTTLQFKPSQICTDSPTYLRRFGSDDFYEIDFSNNESITSETITFVDHMTGLKKLRLRDTDVNNDCLEAVAKMTGLENLDISNTNISGDALAKLPLLSQLEVLRISRTKNVSPAIEALLSSTRLRQLHIDQTTLTKKDLQNISAMHNVTLLSLSNTRLTNEDLAILSPMPRLIVLKIEGATFKPSVIPILKKFRALTQLNIDCDNWSKNDIATLKVALPGVKVEVEDKLEFPKT